MTYSHAQTQESENTMKKTTKHAALAKPRTVRPQDPTNAALRRIVEILRPLKPEQRAQVMRTIAAFYQEGG